MTIEGAPMLRRFRYVLKKNMIKVFTFYIKSATTIYDLLTQEVNNLHSGFLNFCFSKAKNLKIRKISPPSLAFASFSSRSSLRPSRRPNTFESDARRCETFRDWPSGKYFERPRSSCKIFWFIFFTNE